MDPITASALIGVGGQIFNGVSNLFTNSANKKNALEMYNRQRVDALADWNMQNSYNSPKAQMTRFKEAGLNPHLIYGQTNTAPAVRSGSADTPKYVAPQLDSSQFNIPMMKLQMDNLKKQGALLDSQAVKNNSETDWKNLNTKFLNENFGTKSSILENTRALLDSKQFNEQQRGWNIQASTKKILADTDLSEAKKAEVFQIIQNLKTTQSLLGEKVKTEKYLNEVQQKLQSMGIVGSTLAQILRLFK